MSIVRVRHDPDLYLDDAFATPEECLHVERRGGHWTYIRELGIETAHDETGFSWELPIDGDPMLEALRARMEKAIGLENAMPETFRFRRYSPGEGHPPHVDRYEADGQLLVATAMLCVHAPEEGGATVFENARPEPYALVPRLGQLAVWFNYREDGAPEESSTHRGDLVMTGSKVTATYFVYAAPELAGYRPI